MPEPELTGRGVRRVLWITLGLNILVSLGKIVVGKLSGSLSMVADGYHSLVDGSNNVIGLFVVGLAYAPPDRGHHYGHRKFETAATLGIGLALLALAYRVVENAFLSVRHEAAPAIGALNWVVMATTLGVNLFVAAYEAREGRRLGSDYLIADAAHTRSDIYVTLGVVASFAGVQAGLHWVDSVVAAGIAAFIAFLAVRILVGAFHVLTDRAAIPPERIAEVVEGVPGVRGCRDARTRGGHGAVYVDLVALVDGGRPLREAHAVSDSIEDAVRAAFPGVVDVVVHLEPW
ncbi:MAG TPA: cation diffusion facilitator family transporter [Vicinamibacteria bacterium]|nr:cation diffusion facilitator family transporter [Vicinamibacteria bacterium]